MVQLFHRVSVIATLVAAALAIPSMKRDVPAVIVDIANINFALTQLNNNISQITANISVPAMSQEISAIVSMWYSAANDIEVCGPLDEGDAGTLLPMFNDMQGNISAIAASVIAAKAEIASLDTNIPLVKTRQAIVSAHNATETFCVNLCDVFPSDLSYQCKEIKCAIEGIMGCVQAFYSQ